MAKQDTKILLKILSIIPFVLRLYSKKRIDLQLFEKVSLDT